MAAVTKRLSVFLLQVLLLGCSSRFEEVEVAELEKMWTDSSKNSAESWWYAGEDAGFEYIVVRRGATTRRFKVPRVALSVREEVRRPLEERNQNWANLKTGDLIFEHLPLVPPKTQSK